MQRRFVNFEKTLDVDFYRCDVSLTPLEVLTHRLCRFWNSPAFGVSNHIWLSEARTCDEGPASISGVVPESPPFAFESFGFPSDSLCHPFGTYGRSFPVHSSVLHPTVELQARKIRVLIETVARSFDRDTTRSFPPTCVDAAISGLDVDDRHTSFDVTLRNGCHTFSKRAWALFVDQHLKYRSLQTVYFEDGDSVPSYRAPCGLAAHRVRIPFLQSEHTSCALNYVHVTTDGFRIRICSLIPALGQDVHSRFIGRLTGCYVATKVLPCVSGVYTWDIITCVDQRLQFPQPFDALLRGKYKKWEFVENGIVTQSRWLIPTVFVLTDQDDLDADASQSDTYISAASSQSKPPSLFISSDSGESSDTSCSIQSRSTASTLSDRTTPTGNTGRNLLTPAELALLNSSVQPRVQSKRRTRPPSRSHSSNPYGK